jgi:hypothetical protein
MLAGRSGAIGTDIKPYIEGRYDRNFRSSIGEIRWAGIHLNNKLLAAIRMDPGRGGRVELRNPF